MKLPDIVILNHPYPLRVSDLINDIFVFALLMFLVRRFSIARKEEERLAAEFEAARGVQSLLIPAVPPATPGFAVEHVYLPATEVGGDFFQVLPGDDGSLLIVVGDVSGKGLKAAMTVSAIIGALRNENARQPGEVLRKLNRVLHGEISGFVTCAAVLISADGTMTLANAGHLSPYRKGKEVATPNGLPLAIAAESSYEEILDKLAPGERLTFISDGVVEASNARRELYGFDRTMTLSNQSAGIIAEAARQFGQEDDITVLSVTRTANIEVAIA
jgi:serine phosphatase RsbU (regulator of sigma subunit)